MLGQSSLGSWEGIGQPASVAPLDPFALEPGQGGAWIHVSKGREGSYGGVRAIKVSHESECSGRAHDAQDKRYVYWTLLSLHVSTARPLLMRYKMRMV